MCLIVFPAKRGGKEYCWQRKPYLGQDSVAINAENQQFGTIKTSPNSTDDVEVVPEFLKLIDDKINTLCDDGAYIINEKSIWRLPT